MLYSQLIQAAGQGKIVRAAVIGAGTFGAGIVAQASATPALIISAVVDANIETARRAFQQAGISDSEIAACESPVEARRALETGKRVVSANADVLFDQPIDVIVESTGLPEPAARHARDAIAHGKHVAMVTKEADAAVGPILKHRADRAGVVYTAVDGDQHGLLISLIYWAQATGLEILCGGKALDQELIFNRSTRSLAHHRQQLNLTESQAAAFEPMSRAFSERASALGTIGGAKPWDLVEMTIAANATALIPDTPRTHCPALWTTEIPAVLCPRDFGGILDGTNRIDTVQVIRQKHEAGLGGGVFIVARAPTDSLRRLLKSKGAITHPDGDASLILHPRHLLSVEAIASILAAGLLKIPTGAIDYQPRFDAVYRASRALRAGETVGDDHSPDLTAEILPAAQLSDGAPLPAGLAQSMRLRKAVHAGELLTYDVIEPPASSILWDLRREQDAQFKGMTDFQR